MKRTFCLLVALTCILSCKKQGPAGPAGEQGPKGETGPAGTTPTGTISGKILQYDAYGVWLNAGLNTTTVSIAGSNISSVTNAEGSYTLTDVPAGTHEINIRKPSSGLGRIKQVLFPGNGELHVNGNIADKAPYEFTGGYIKDTLNSAVKVNLHYASSTKSRLAVILFSRSANIDPEDPKTFQVTWAFNVYPNVTTQKEQITFQIITALANTFQSGSTVYCNVYPCSAIPGRYYDPFDKKYVYPGCGAAVGGVHSFTLP